MESRLEDGQLSTIGKRFERIAPRAQKSEGKWLADRIKAVFLLGSGQTVGDVAESDDVDALKQRLYRGRVARLTQEQKEKLSTWLGENRCLKVGEILQYLRKMYGVFLSRSHMCRLLRELDFAYKKPKHVWKNASENEVFYFGDSCLQRHNSLPAYGWIRRGEEWELKSNCLSQYININGVINIDTLATCVTFPKTNNPQTTIKFSK
ncbi:MAG: winged helix-turn-helix domain-containing protein [Planctomycetia bacterium]|nr:winged helix-turn-helix domain-containing protein [Planctomycetia bacterium]